MSDQTLAATAPLIDAHLVRRLIATQFPHWADLPIKPAASDGWDNRTFHLGEHMKVRLPSAPWYVAQVAKEYRWLPALAPLLPLPIPAPLAMGTPGEGYPWAWSIYAWLAGETASASAIADPHQFARDLGHFLVALQRIDATAGPPAGAHNFFRGGPLTVYDAETRRALDVLAGDIETDMALVVWEAALAATWTGTPVWVHGDVSAGNLLIENGQLSAVIDFGSSGVGDPACDVVIAWTFLDDASRQTFRAALPLDEATWARGRGWALWKALITLAEHRATNPVVEAQSRRIIDIVVAEQRRLAPSCALGGEAISDRARAGVRESAP